MTAGVVMGFVKSVEQSGVDQGARPNHGRGPNHELSHKATKGKTNDLTAECEEYLVGEGDYLAVEDALDQYNISGVGTRSGDVSHDCDADMLLDVEWARVQ